MYIGTITKFITIYLEDFSNFLGHRAGDVCHSHDEQDFDCFWNFHNLQDSDAKHMQWFHILIKYVIRLSKVTAKPT